MIVESERVPKMYSVAFRLPAILWVPSRRSFLGFTYSDELKYWLEENGFNINRNDYNDVRDYFADSRYIKFVDLTPVNDDGCEYCIEHYCIAFIYVEDGMAFKLGWL